MAGARCSLHRVTERTHIMPQIVNARDRDAPWGVERGHLRPLTGWTEHPDGPGLQGTDERTDYAAALLEPISLARVLAGPGPALNPEACDHARQVVAHDDLEEQARRTALDVGQSQLVSLVVIEGNECIWKPDACDVVIAVVLHTSLIGRSQFLGWHVPWMDRVGRSAEQVFPAGSERRPGTIQCSEQVLPIHDTSLAAHPPNSCIGADRVRCGPFGTLRTLASARAVDAPALSCR
jgi:hypothetical protein